MSEVETRVWIPMKTRGRFKSSMWSTGEKARYQVMAWRARQKEQILRFQRARARVAIEIFMAVNFARIQRCELSVTLRVGSPNAFILARPFKHSLRVRVSVRDCQRVRNPFVKTTA